MRTTLFRLYPFAGHLEAAGAEEPMLDEAIGRPRPLHYFSFTGTHFFLTLSRAFGVLTYSSIKPQAPQMYWAISMDENQDNWTLAAPLCPFTFK